MWNLAVLAPSHSLWPHKMLSKLNEDKCTQHLHSVKFKTPHKEAFCFYKTLDGGGGVVSVPLGRTVSMRREIC